MKLAQLSIPLATDTPDKLCVPCWAARLYEIHSLPDVVPALDSTT